MYLPPVAVDAEKFELTHYKRDFSVVKGKRCAPPGDTLSLPFFIVPVEGTVEPVLGISPERVL
ncbi:hypothetical protein MU1_56890 [Paenibacillus glycanilyticus]|uniref:Uncharacterized protein n=1 Tax=Paenibacillus glycanilyticus TaxID=126569 RepID=A0ABQ6GKC4_9BACL|nr:hypothetical protein MU1_56890 [Paenibacillus glycanilyticus]